MKRPTLFLLVGLAACGSDAPSPDEVRARIATDLVAVANTAEASRADGASLPDSTQFAVFQSTFSQLSSRIPTQMFTEDLPDMEMNDPFDGAAAAKWLNENLFTNANHAGDGIYNVPASFACESDEGIDPECAQAFAKIQLRIRVTENDDVLRLALQLGPNHDEPLEVGLSATLLSLTIDLDEAEDAVKSLAGKLGGEVPELSLSGEATVKLEVTGAAAVKVSLDIDRDIAVAFEDTTFSSKAAHVASLALDGAAKSMDLVVGLGETKAHVPDDFEGTFDLDLPGLSAAAHFAEGQPLAITNISLGARTTTLKIDGQTALSFDLNPNDGRKLDAQISGDTLTVTPRLDLRTTVNHTVLGDDAPVYDVTRVLLDGGLRAKADESIEALGGFSIETNPASYGFSAAAGQCVRGTETYDPTRDDYYTTWAVGTCN
ncbi:MAG: hypothetical protein M4D80_23560 [Myxococcota bacterium]|nr:hypothetical protein [Deltaproteobacteria bacterium]MDQ3338154.1 hypothetical protein [Myxococcota bacterium]